MDALWIPVWTHVLMPLLDSCLDVLCIHFGFLCIPPICEVVLRRDDKLKDNILDPKTILNDSLVLVPGTFLSVL